MRKIQNNSRAVALLRSAGILFVCLLSTHNVYSDITADSTVGTTVNLSGSDYTLSGGTQVGANLFQSFSVFDVHTGETATFQGDASVARILGRVTGGASSSIDGTLSSSISGADLYLINPAGVVFGENATLDVSGSFYVSTADYVNLGTDGRFDVSTPGNSVLTSSAPSAFGFVSATPAPIDFNGSLLQVPLGETLSVIGGDINISDATLYATEGRIDIVSVGSSGEVRPTSSGIDTVGMTQLGDISISHSTTVFDRPFDGGFPLANIDVSGDSGGQIYIRGGNFVSDNGAVFADTRDVGSAGSINISLQGDLQLANEARMTSDKAAGGGFGGDIVVNAKNIVLETGGLIQANTFGSGSAGSVTLNADESVSISGRSAIDDPRLSGNQRSGIASFTFSTGAGGTVTITADSVSLSDEGIISSATLREGNAGNIEITANAVSVSGKGIISSAARGEGNAGSIKITTNTVSVANEALIDASTAREGNAGSILVNTTDMDVSGGAAIVSNSLGEGDGGDITINAAGTVTVSGVAESDPLVPSLIASNAFAQGNGGIISISADRLVVADTGGIQTILENDPTLGQASIDVNTRAGQIQIQARNTTLTGGGQLLSSNLFSSGQGGDIQMNVIETLQISGRSADSTVVSGVFSGTSGSGDSGRVQLSVSSLNLDDHGVINTSTSGAGNAGAIDVSASTVELNNGALLSSSTEGSGGGGNITVNASETIMASGIGSDGMASGFYSIVQVLPGGQSADASGDGGNINLTATAIKLDEQATISARSDGTGNAGSIDINAGAKLELFNAASITTESSNSGGGRIDIVALDLLHLRNSKITSSVANGAGNGGDITIDPEFVILDSSQILANADSGSGGNINITTRYFIASPDSIVDASANTGIDGEVNIDSPTTDIIGAVEDLPESFLNAAALLKQRCAARASGTSSSFVVTGSGGVPASPDGLLYTGVSGFGNQGANSAKTVSVPVMVKAELNGIPALLMGCGG